MNILKKIGDFLPLPFWVYFLSILAGTLGILPHESPLYDAMTRHVLPVAILLMLIGTPVSELLTMGPKALTGMAIGTVTIFVAQIIAFVVMARFLPDEGWKAVGALMGTWIGGSANMVAVKEIVGLSSGTLGALVIVDTILSYFWMAILLTGSKFQKKFDEGIPSQHATASSGNQSPINTANHKWPLVLIIGFIFGEICVLAGKFIGAQATILPTNGWILLSASTAGLLLALTPLRNLREWGSQKVGTLLLYSVLVTIGAKTTLTATLGAPVFLVYGILALVLHGIFSLVLGKFFRVPLFLLSTASQANIGGAVSAPIVAEAYQPGTAHIGVLMAVLGAVLGTYLGVFGGYLCKGLQTWLK